MRRSASIARRGLPRRMAATDATIAWRVGRDPAVERRCAEQGRAGGGRRRRVCPAPFDCPPVLPPSVAGATRQSYNRLPAHTRPVPSSIQSPPYRSQHPVGRTTRRPTRAPPPRCSRTAPQASLRALRGAGMFALVLAGNASPNQELRHATCACHRLSRVRNSFVAQFAVRHSGVEVGSGYTVMA